MKLRLPNKLIAAIVAAASPVLFSTLSTATLGAAAVVTVAGQQAQADGENGALIVNYTSQTSGRTDRSASLSKSGSEDTGTGSTSYSGAVNLTDFTATGLTSITISGSATTQSIATIADNGGYGGRVSFNNTSSTLSSVTFNKGIEANLAGAGINDANKEWVFDNASFYLGSGNTVNANIVVNEGGVRMNGSSTASYTINGSLSGTGDFFMCTGDNGVNIKFTGDLSEFSGAFYSSNATTRKREVILGNGGAAATVTNGVFGGSIGKSDAVYSKATLDYTGDLTVNGSIYASTLTLSHLSTLTIKGTLASDLIYTSAAITAANAVLNNSQLSIRTDAGDKTHTLTALKVLETGTLSVLESGTSGQGWNSTVNIGTLSNETGQTATLVVQNAARAYTSFYNLNGGAFAGEIVLNGTATTGTRRTGLQLNGVNAQDSVVTFKAETADGTNRDNNNKLGLGIGADTSVKGIRHAEDFSVDAIIYSGKITATNHSADFASQGSDKHTLTITGDDTYITSAAVKANLDLVMNGSGTQVFTGDLSNFNGSVVLNSGAMGFGNSSTNQRTFSGDVSGAGTLYFYEGSLKYTGTATNKGGVVIQDGATVEISSENFLGTSVTVNSGANLRFQRKNTSDKGSYIENVNANKITLAGGTILGIVNDEGNVTNTIADLNVTAASVIQEEHWASHWNINKLTGEGDLTWRAWSNNTASSVMKISGEGAYSGELTVDGRSATNGWSGSGYKYFSVLEVASASALQSAVVNLDGKNEKNILSLALNSSTVNLGGLDGTEHSIVYSGAAASSTRDVPAGDGTTRTMVINSAAETQHEFAGVLQSGINITMAGAGTQSFTGDLSAFNGSVEASNGVLKLADSGSGTVSLKALNLSGGNIELAGGSYSIGANDNVHGVFGRDNAAINSSLILNNGASLTLTTPYAWWQFQVNAGEESGVYVKGKAAGDDGAASMLNATLNDGGIVKIKALDTSSLTGAHITNSGTVAQNFAIDQNYITVADADYSINYGTSDKTVQNKLQGTAVTNEGTGTLTISNAANTLAGLYAKTGNIAISTNQSVSGSAKAEDDKSIIVNSGKTLSLGTGATIAAGSTSAATLTGATATVGGISKTAGAATASIDKATVTISGQGYSIDGVTISDSNVTVANGATGTLSNSTITMTHAQGDAPHTNTFVGVKVSENVSAYVAYGNTLQFLNQSTAVNLKDLVIGSGAKVEAYIGTPTQEQINAAQNGTMGIEQNISVSGTLTANTNAKLYADLTLNNGTKLDIADATSGSKNGLTMGSSVTIAQNAKINLSNDIINGLNSLTIGEGLTLFSGVDAFNINGAAYDANLTYKASDFFNLSNSDVAVTRPWDFVVKFGDDAALRQGGSGQSIFIWRETPEPATATLSLLALAALAARRKRK